LLRKWVPPDPELEALCDELDDLRVKRVMLAEAPKPDLMELNRVSLRMHDLEKLIYAKQKRPHG